MFMQVDKKTVHRNRVVLGLVLAFGFAAQAFAGTSLSCAGYPKNVTVFTDSGISTFVQVCKIVPLTAPLTPRLTVTSIAGNVTAHGGQTEGQIPHLCADYCAGRNRGGGDRTGQQRQHLHG
jgi:hypothetical protein